MVKVQSRFKAWNPLILERQPRKVRPSPHAPDVSDGVVAYIITALGVDITEEEFELSVEIIESDDVVDLNDMFYTSERRFPWWRTATTPKDVMTHMVDYCDITGKRALLTDLATINTYDERRQEQWSLRFLVLSMARRFRSNVLFDTFSELSYYSRYGFCSAHPEPDAMLAEGLRDDPVLRELCRTLLGLIDTFQRSVG